MGTASDAQSDLDKHVAERHGASVASGSSFIDLRHRGIPKHIDVRKLRWVSVICHRIRLTV
jgi:hypothetical protein